MSGNLFDSIEGVEEDLVNTVSGDRRIYSRCPECGQANGGHDILCDRNHDLYDEIEASVEHPLTMD